MSESIISPNLKKIYVGIDVHKKTYAVTVLGSDIVKKRVSMSACPKALISFLKNNYQNSEIYSVYEAGFSGFHLHRKLLDSGIKNIVVNPSSIEISANKKVKTDKKDSYKLAEHLSLGRLIGINIPSLDQEYKRLLSRTREQLMIQRVRTGNQIKNKLFQFGYIDFSEEKVMSRKYISNLVYLELKNELKITINCLANIWLYLQSQIKELEKELKKQAENESHIELIYQSVPGIGEVSARVLANELGDMLQFKNEKSLFSFVGLTPVEYSSGENIRQGNISRQGNSRLRKILVECAWTTISKDPEMEESFNRIAAKRGKKRAIVAIARRLIGKIRACFKDKSPYKINISKIRSIKTEEKY